MAFDEALRLTGPVVAAGASPNGNSIEAAAIAASGNGTNGWKYAGKNRSYVGEGRIGGAFFTGGTFQFTVSEATDAAGTGAAVIASGAVLTATHRAVYGSANADGKTAPADATGPARLGFTTGAGGWVRASFVTGGTTPSAATVSFDLVPQPNAVLRSGS